MNRARILIWQISPSPDSSGLQLGADRFIPIATVHELSNLLPCLGFPPIGTTQQLDYWLPPPSDPEKPSSTTAFGTIGLCGPDGDPEAPSAEHSAEIRERITPIVLAAGVTGMAFEPAVDSLEDIYGEPGPYLHVPMSLPEAQVEEILTIAPCFMIIRGDIG